MVFDNHLAILNLYVVNLPHSVWHSSEKEHEARMNLRFSRQPAVRGRFEKPAQTDDLAPRHIIRLSAEFQSSRQFPCRRIVPPVLKPWIFITLKQIPENESFFRIQRRYP